MFWLRSVTLIQRRRSAQHRGSQTPPHRHLAAGISLTCQREARCRFVFNCHILLRSSCCSYVWPPLAHQVCFTFYLMNCTHEVIQPLQQSSSKLSFSFSFFFQLLTCLAPGLIFSLETLLSNNEIKKIFSLPSAITSHKSKGSLCNALPPMPVNYSVLCYILMLLSWE